MKPSKPKILVITPVRHIEGVVNSLEDVGFTTYMDDPFTEEVLKIIKDFDAIFTNPNKSKIFIGKEIIDMAKNLKVICTASTGTNHIDKAYAYENDIKVLSLTEEREVISRISSTAEHAFTLTMAGLRNLVPSHRSVMKGEWDYTRFIGRQMNCLTVGVIGYGRLGSMYSQYCLAFGSKVLIYDPYKSVNDPKLEQVENLDLLLKQSDFISLHVHVCDETQGMINKNSLNKMKDDVLLVNTSRGEIINEQDLVNFLKINPNAKVATDVLSDEIKNRNSSPLLNFAQRSQQVIVTSHIGGMTSDAQQIAYNHSVLMLKDFLNIKNHEK